MSAPSRSTADARPDRRTLLAFLGVVLFGGGNALAVRQTFLELDPMWSAGLRMVAAGLVLVVFVAMTGRRFPRQRGLWGAALYGAVGFAGFFAPLYLGLEEVPAGTTMVLVALTPLFTFGLAIVQGQERFRIQGLIGAVVSVVGVAIVFVDQLAANVPLTSLLLILVGVLSLAESGVIVKWIPRGDPFATNAVAMLTSAAILIPVSAILGEAWVVPTQAATWVALAYLVVLGSVALFTLNVFIIQRWTASAASYATLLMPPVTVALATILTGDPIRPSFVLGSVVILGGVYLGAFLTNRPGRSTAIASPECLPIQDCADADAATA